MNGKLLELWVGNRDTGILVRPDDKYPAMWRVWQGSRVSDMVNLTRAKDAAVSWMNHARRRGAQWGQSIEWKVCVDSRKARRRV
jgi:hypothetical protein